MRSKEKEYFNKVAGVFDSRFNVYSRRAGRLRVNRRLELFSRHCNFSSGLKVLEAGCGTGEYTKSLSEYRMKLFSSDISYNMLKNAVKKNIGRKGIFLVSDIERMPFFDNTFDAVIGNSVLHHVNARKAMAEVFRVLKKGGKFVFSEPNMVNPHIFLQKKIGFIRQLSGDSPLETAFLRWQIKGVIEEAGFSFFQVEPFDFLHPYTPDMLTGITEKLGRLLERLFFIREIAGSLLIRGVK
ncbi:MAG: methyltransferase domain-containing protein [Candidatus Omnitrophica bacterium]|nr:methyltransferase domain-containing protein [Candidatus Omnitrophota bacterium]